MDCVLISPTRSPLPHLHFCKPFSRSLIKMLYKRAAALAVVLFAATAITPVPRAGALAVFVAATAAAAAPVAILLGGGNVGTNGDASAATLQQLDILSAHLNASGCRSNLYPGAYIDKGTNWNTPTPQSMNAFMAAAMARRISPIVLFEYYAEYLNATGFGTFEQWRGIGAAFAAYLRPGGTWAAANGAPPGFGVTVFSAINEPDRGSGFVGSGSPGPVNYSLALSGLSAGVKSVDPSLRVGPGGFMRMNANNDPTLSGLAAHLAPLWNNGSLDFIDLHTYVDVQYAPMAGTHDRSAAANYAAVRRVTNITRDIAFHSTEFNFKRRLVDEAEAAAGLLTSIWDNLGVVAGTAPASVGVTSLAMPWNIFNTNTSDVDYGMAVSTTPYVPTLRGSTFALVMSILAATSTWEWVSLDPFGTGVFTLSDPHSTWRLAVWQDRAGWSSLPDPHTFNFTDLPPTASVIETYGWNGLRGTTPISGGGGGSVLIRGLPGNETYMFVAH